MVVTRVHFAARASDFARSALPALVPAFTLSFPRRIECAAAPSRASRVRAPDRGDRAPTTHGVTFNSIKSALGSARRDATRERVAEGRFVCPLCSAPAAPRRAASSQVHSLDFPPSSFFEACRDFVHEYRRCNATHMKQVDHSIHTAGARENETEDVAGGGGERRYEPTRTHTVPSKSNRVVYASNLAISALVPTKIRSRDSRLDENRHENAVNATEPLTRSSSHLPLIVDTSARFRCRRERRL